MRNVIIQRSFYTGGKLQFDQMPLLEINGMKLVQSGAIARYLGRVGGMMGENDKQMAK